MKIPTTPNVIIETETGDTISTTRISRDNLTLEITNQHGTTRISLSAAEAAALALVFEIEAQFMEEQWQAAKASLIRKSRSPGNTNPSDNGKSSPPENGHSCQ